MKRSALAVALGAAGCSALVGGDLPGHERVSYQGERDARSVALALAAFEIVAHERLGVAWEWSRGVIDERTTLPDALNGATRTPDHVVIRDLGALSSGALAHELIHAMLWERRGDPDRDHASGAGPWTAEHDLLIDDVNEWWRVLGL